MQQSLEEYNKFLERLDKLVMKMDDILEKTRIKKTVRFKDKEEIFYIPPREIPRHTILIDVNQNPDDLYADLFYCPS